MDWLSDSSMLCVGVYMCTELPCSGCRSWCKEYRKCLPFKNSRLESKPPTHEVLFFTNRRDLEYDIKHHIQSQLDPESVCRYVICIVENLYIIRTTVRQDKVSWDFMKEWFLGRNHPSTLYTIVQGVVHAREVSSFHGSYIYNSTAKKGVL